MTSQPAQDEFAALFAPHGGTDFAYLGYHFPRYLETKRRALASRSYPDGARLLDIGAHWLHQALLYAIDGFQVTALDLPAVLNLPEVRALAQAHAICLLPNGDLEHPLALRTVADDSIDIVLFTEIIEHLAFNPVAMWREIHRLMKPGARIVISTPNYYALRSIARRWSRALRLRGGAISIHDVLMVRTLGHHWKEYSLGELRDYFRMLSPDFRCVASAYTEDYQQAYRSKRGGAAVHCLEWAIPPLRPDIYLEIELASKDKGIVVEPHW